MVKDQTTTRNPAQMTAAEKKAERAAKVAELKKRVESGTYSIDRDGIVHNLLRDFADTWG